MKVYVAEIGGDYDISPELRIFDSPERAIGALHQEGWTWTRSLLGTPPPIEFWVNGQSGDLAVEIRALDLIADGPERPVDQIIHHMAGGERRQITERTAARYADGISG